MKVIKPKGLLESTTFYGLVLINTILFFLPLPDVLYKFLAFMIGNVILYSGGIRNHYLFEYDSDKVVVKNTWNPFFFEGYWIKNLKKVELDYFNGVGHGVIIYSDNNKKIYICACDKSDLQNFVNEINLIIKKS